MSRYNEPNDAGGDADAIHRHALSGIAPHHPAQRTDKHRPAQQVDATEADPVLAVCNVDDRQRVANTGGTDFSHQRGRRGGDSMGGNETERGDARSRRITCARSAELLGEQGSWIGSQRLGSAA